MPVRKQGGEAAAVLESVEKKLNSKTMNRQDAHRALELLEEYHSQLVRPQDQTLRSAIERVIRIFKSRLFQALLDIQEFYELTLLDDEKSLQQKTQETLYVATRWEQNPPITSSKPLSERAMSLQDDDDQLPPPPPPPTSEFQMPIFDQSHQIHNSNSIRQPGSV